ncbi:MAG: glycosyltransferase family 4 protein [Thermoplasmata archaeon]
MGESLEVNFMTSGLGQRTSGQSRFLINLAIGMKRRGHTVTVSALSVTTEGSDTLKDAGVDVLTLGESLTSLRTNVARMTSIGGLGHRLARLAVGATDPDWFVVLSDDILDAIRVLPQKRSVLLSNGDMALLYLSRSFYTRHRSLKRILACGGADMLLRHASFARDYSLRLGNSQFTRRLMSHLFAEPFQGFVYPPIDPITFHPNGPSTHGEYALAVARNESEQRLDVLREVSKRGSLTIVGGWSLRGARNVGVVPDEKLAELYRGAKFLVFPSVAEPFGYPIAEAMGCGTPTLAFDAGGPAEQIVDGECGWLAGSTPRLLERAMELFNNGYPTTVRARAIDQSALYSIESSASALENHLKNPTSGREMME